MRTKQEIESVLTLIDNELQKNVGDMTLSDTAIRMMINTRITLLWVLGKLDSMK